MPGTIRNIGQLPGRAPGRNVVAVLERRSGHGRADVDDRLAEEAERSDRRARVAGDALLVSLLDLQNDLDFGARKRDVADLADLDAGDAHDGAALEAFHVLKLRLELVALPGKPGGAAHGDDDHRCEEEGHDSDDADLEFRPGE